MTANRSEPGRGDRVPTGFVCWSHTAMVAILACVYAATMAPAAALSPSFQCLPPPLDALSNLTCTSPSLTRAQVRMVQTYYALRQYVVIDRHKDLQAEFIAMMAAARRVCGLPLIGVAGDRTRVPPPADAASCVAAAYEAQRLIWFSRLTGAAAEEAARTPEQNISLQDKLRTLGYLPKDATIDGVFGSATRNALLVWQRENRRPETSFFSDADATILLGVALVAEVPDPLLVWRSEPLVKAEFHGQTIMI